MEDYGEEMRRHTYISCWHENEHESMAMWKLYMKEGRGVAVQTTYGRLYRELCGKAHEYDGIRVGRVQYVDYPASSMPQGTRFPFECKRMSFAHEREVRAMIQYPDKPESYPIAEFGIPVSVNIERLVVEIHVAPQTSDLERDTIQALLSRFGLERTLKRSCLDEEALY